MKYLITLLLGVSVIDSARACDVCGCSAGNQYLGLLPKSGVSFINFQFQHNGFESDHPSLFAGRPNEHTRDYYNTFQVWGRYAINRRMQLFAFVPYRYNIQHADTTRSVSSGLGDVSVLANVTLVQSGETQQWQHQLLAGGGIKLPTGKYTGITEMDKLGIPNIQPGTGSWDIVANANYTVKRNSFGINADVAYTFTTANKESYKYGDRFSAGALGFYSFGFGQFSIVPQGGVRYEYSLHDYDNYERKWLNEQTGGYMSFAVAGIQAYIKRVGVRLTYQQPLMQHYSAGNVTAKRRMEAGAFFLL